ARTVGQRRQPQDPRAGPPDGPWGGRPLRGRHGRTRGLSPLIGEPPLGANRPGVARRLPFRTVAGQGGHRFTTGPRIIRPLAGPRSRTTRGGAPMSEQTLTEADIDAEIGRASCREREQSSAVAGSVKQNTYRTE